MMNYRPAAMHSVDMSERFRHLKQLQVPKPCPASWDEMTGDEQTRHCSHCNKNVHNLTAMSAEDAEKVLESGKACVRFARDDKGRIITRTRLIAQTAAAAAAAITLSGCTQPLVAGASAPPEPKMGKQVSTEYLAGEAVSTPIDDSDMSLGRMAPVEPPSDEMIQGEIAPVDDATR